METLLYGTRKGQPDYMEEIISTNPDIFEAAKKWAQEQGFDRFRISKIDLTKKPDFTKALNLKKGKRK